MSAGTFPPFYLGRDGVLGGKVMEATGGHGDSPHVSWFSFQNLEVRFVPRFAFFFALCPVYLVWNLENTQVSPGFPRFSRFQVFQVQCGLQSL